MCLIAKTIRISRAKFHCNRLTTVQDIPDYASLIFWHTLYKDCYRNSKQSDNAPDMFHNYFLKIVFN